MKQYLCVATLAFLSACTGSSDPAAQRQAQATRIMTNEADRQVGMPRITNFQERRFAKDIYEARDQTTITWTYTQGIDGKLECLGKSIGYGLPYAVQLTKNTYPQYVCDNSSGTTTATCGTYELQQAEPNGLYMPDNAEGTWVRLIGPKGEAVPVYVEPRITVSPFELKGAIVSVPCGGS